jgi:FAD/FMN-containing dehydrogenase
MPASQAPPRTIILTPADPGWDDARKAWNLVVDQHPAAVAQPRSAEDAAAAVRYAREHGLRVAAQATGHSAAPLGDLAGTLLVQTSAMRHVTVDPVTRTARAEAGAIWRDVAEAAATRGLAGLSGSSPSVGVAGYTLGGGISWLSRSYGLSANNVQAIEVVTADGRLVRADAYHNRDLFWALRGGGGSFALVTAIELRLFPLTEVIAGLLWWPADAASDVLQAWRELTQSDLPEEFTSSARLARFPAVPDIPLQLRGKSFVIVTVVSLATATETDTLLAPLRALDPVTDTVATIPAERLCRLDSEPDHPVPSVSDGLMLASLPAEAIGEFVGVFAGNAGRQLLALDLIHVGGEMSRARPGNGALAAINADYVMFAVGMAPAAEAVPAAASAVGAARTAMSPWAARQMYLNLAGTRRHPASFWTPQTYDRLRAVKAAYDPDDVIRSNHPIPPASC